MFTYEIYTTKAGDVAFRLVMTHPKRETIFVSSLLPTFDIAERIIEDMQTNPDRYAMVYQPNTRGKPSFAVQAAGRRHVAAGEVFQTEAECLKYMNLARHAMQTRRDVKVFM